MARWDVYLDESGTFDEGGHNLIGGFAVPSRDRGRSAVNAALCQQWQEAARQSVMDLAGPGYDHTHAAMNSPGMYENRQCQRTITQHYVERIRSLNGYAVIFDNLAGLTGVDNMSTYLAMMGKGLLMLLMHLQRITMDSNIQLYAHLAERKNVNEDQCITKVLHLETPPETAKSATIPLEEYKLQIRNNAFVLADATTQLDPATQFLFDHMEILRDKKTTDAQGNKVFAANDYTIPCDFICNTFYRGTARTSNQSEWQSDPHYQYAYGYENCILLDVVNAVQVSTDALVRMKANHTYFPVFCDLLTSDFESRTTQKFFEALNAAPYVCQSSFIHQLIEHVRVPATISSDHLRTVNLIEQIMTQTEKGIGDRQLRAELHANLYLFLYAVYTHINHGAKMMESRKQLFSLCPLLPKDQLVPLLLMFLNRDIVTYTDMFQYDEAEKAYESLKLYWEGGALDANALLGELIDTPVPIQASEAYGRAIGSYVQLLQHRLRTAGAEERHRALQTASELDSKAMKQFAHSPSDQLRHHQNMADLYAELKQFDDAFAHLSKAAALPCDGPITAEQCQAILNGSSHAPYLYYHYVRLMNEMAWSGDARSAIMEAAAHPGMDAMLDSICSPILRAQVEWKWASTLMLGDRWKTGGKMFLDAATLLKETGERLLVGIACGILAEYTGRLIQRKANKDKISDAVARLRKTYEQFIRLTGTGKDPFDGLMQNVSARMESDVLLEASRRIPY